MMGGRGTRAGAGAQGVLVPRGRKEPILEQLEAKSVSGGLGEGWRAGC